MTNELLQTNDTNTTTVLATALLVAIEMSLKSWRLVMAPEGATRKRVKTIEAGNFLELFQAVAEAREPSFLLRKRHACDDRRNING